MQPRVALEVYTLCCGYGLIERNRFAVQQNNIICCKVDTSLVKMEAGMRSVVTN